MIAGIDLSTFAVDVVLLDEDSDAATWHPFELQGQDAFDRTRDVGAMMPGNASAFWDDILAVGIEAPFGPNKNTLLRVQGAILTCIPRNTLVQPLAPASWRVAVGLAGNCSKDEVRSHVARTIKVGHDAMPNNSPIIWPHIASYWPQDACDAYCIALATRTLLQRTEAA